MLEIGGLKKVHATGKAGETPLLIISSVGRQTFARVRWVGQNPQRWEKPQGSCMAVDGFSTTYGRRRFGLAWHAACITIDNLHKSSSTYSILSGGTQPAAIAPREPRDSQTPGLFSVLGRPETSTFYFPGLVERSCAIAGFHPPVEVACPFIFNDLGLARRVPFNKAIRLSHPRLIASSAARPSSPIIAPRGPRRSQLRGPYLF